MTFLLWFSALIHALTTGAKGIIESEQDNKPDGFLFSKWLIVIHTNPIQFIKFLRQQSFITGLNKMIFCQSTTFVFFAGPAMNASFPV